MLNHIVYKTDLIMDLFQFKTDQIQSFKNLIESLKEIMVETNLELSRTAIKISKMNVLNSICCIVNLTSDELNRNENCEYFCEYPDEKPLTLGINLIHFSKILRNISPDNILYLHVNESDKNVLKIVAEMTNRAVVTTYTMNFTEVNVEKLNYPDNQFDKIINIESKYFQKQIKDINNLNLKYLEIIANTSKQMIITGYGGFITKETIIDSKCLRDDDKYTISVENEQNNRIFQGKYEVKDLMCLSKFTNLSKIFTLKLKNDVPLFVTIEVENLGNVTLVIHAKGLTNE